MPAIIAGTRRLPRILGKLIETGALGGDVPSFLAVGNLCQIGHKSF
jgi:hypothetical protein